MPLAAVFLSYYNAQKLLVAMRYFLKKLTRLFPALSGIFFWGRYPQRGKLSHYPGTARFVGPWVRGRWCPSHPDYRPWADDDDEGYSGSILFCRKTFKTWRGDTDVRKPRSTREW